MSVEKTKRTVQIFYRLIFTGLITLMWGGHTVRAGDAKGPKMFLEKDVVHVGEVHEGEVIKHGFRVFNRGDETLRIEKVKPG